MLQVTVYTLKDYSSSFNIPYIYIYIYLAQCFVSILLNTFHYLLNFIILYVTHWISLKYTSYVTQTLPRLHPIFQYVLIWMVKRFPFILCNLKAIVYSFIHSRVRAPLSDRKMRNWNEGFTYSITILAHVYEFDSKLW